MIAKLVIENSLVYLIIQERSIIVTAYDIKIRNINKTGIQYYLNKFLISNKISVDRISQVKLFKTKSHLLDISEEILYEILDRRPSIRLWGLK